MKQNKGFKNNVLCIVSLIPRGQTMTYKQVATLAGNQNASRAVGSILNKNRDPDIPCHRVIRSNGQPGGYAFGPKLKQQILTNEGAVKKNTPA